jgi:hypothetical protein
MDNWQELLNKAPDDYSRYCILRDAYEARIPEMKQMRLEATAALEHGEFQLEQWKKRMDKLRRDCVTLSQSIQTSITNLAELKQLIAERELYRSADGTNS